MKILHVDGDGLAYRSGFSIEKREYIASTPEGEEVTRAPTLKVLRDQLLNMEIPEDILKVKLSRTAANRKWALRNLDAQIDGMCKKYNTGLVSVHLSGGGNFRFQIATTNVYKGNRSEDSKPIHLDYIKDYIRHKYNVIQIEGLEADDSMAIHHISDNGSSSNGDSSVLVTQDKDLNQISGLHYNWVTDEEFWIDEVAGKRFFYQQLLTGDITDNIVGIPGIGPKTAQKLIGDEEDEIKLKSIVYDAYLKHMKDSHPVEITNYIQEVGTLLYILRSEDDNWIF